MTEGVGYARDLWSEAPTLFVTRERISSNRSASERLSQERCTDRHRLHGRAGHDDNVHMRVSAAGIVSKFSP